VWLTYASASGARRFLLIQPADAEFAAALLADDSFSLMGTVATVLEESSGHVL